jgi:ABC-2 type transport system permease protein
VRNTFWNSFRTATWLGWQVEANWTTPILFALYTLARPLALTGILVMLYATVTHGNFGSPMFAYMYVGNAFYTYVGAIMTGMSYAVVDDRERYRTLRSVYVAPVDVRSYMAGRGVARFLTDSAAVVITLVIGIVFLHVPVHARAIDWPLFLAALTVGIVALAMLGLMVSSIALVLPDSAWSFGEAVAGALYLVSGAVFPIYLLPRVLRPLGFAVPISYWLELLRRSLLTAVPGLPAFTMLSNVKLLATFAVLTAALSGLALGIFRWCDRIARERGMIDRITNH